MTSHYSIGKVYFGIADSGEVEKEADLEEGSLREESGETDHGDNDKSINVLSDIPDYEGALVWGKVMAAIHLMQERFAKFQARLSQLKNAMVALWDIIKEFSPNSLVLLLSPSLQIQLHLNPLIQLYSKQYHPKLSKASTEPPLPQTISLGMTVFLLSNILYNYQGKEGH